MAGQCAELKNIAEQLSVLSTNQVITATDLQRFLPEKNMNRLPVLAQHNSSNEFNNEREILYKLFFDMKKDVTELKKMFLEILKNPSLAGNAADYTAESLLNDYNGMNGEMHKQVNAPSVHPQLVPASNAQAVLLAND